MTARGIKNRSSKTITTTFSGQFLEDAALQVGKILTYRLPFDSNLNLEFGFVRVLLWLVYFLPCSVLFTITAFILKKKCGIKLEKLNYAFILASFSIYLFCMAVCLIANANCFAWFLAVPFHIYFTRNDIHKALCSHSSSNNDCIIDLFPRLCR